MNCVDSYARLLDDDESYSPPACVFTQSELGWKMPIWAC